MSDIEQQDPAPDPVDPKPETPIVERAAPTADDETPNRPPGKKASRAGLASVGWLALFLSLLSVAGVGYLLFDQLRNARSDDQLTSIVNDLKQQGREQLAGTERAIAAIDGRIDALQQGNMAVESGLDRLANDLAGIRESTDLVESMAPRVANLERSIASLQGVSVEARNTYLLAEAEYYLQIANAQLQLAGNPYLAKLALEQADDRLLQLADPALTAVRRQLANEIAALGVMEKPDVAGASLTLASLARVVEALPLKQTAKAATGQQDDSSDTGGFARAWRAVKGAVSGLVTYSPPIDAEAPLLTPDSAPLIRSNLALQLQAARLALLRGEQSVFEQSLDDADRWIRHYFDGSAEAVQSARRTLSEIRADYHQAAPPDISQSLRLLRQYQALADRQE